MEKFKILATSRPAVSIGGAVLALLLAWPFVGNAQDKSGKAKDPDPHALHKDKQPLGDQTLASQIAELQAKVVRLEAALKQDNKNTPSGTPDKGGLAGKQDKPSDRISAKFQNCAQCHLTRPSGPLPLSHLEKAGGKDVGTKPDGMEGMDAKKPAGDTGEKKKGAGMGKGMMGDKGMGMGMMADKKKAAGMGMKDMDEKKGMGAMGGDKSEMMDQQMMKMMQMMQQMMEMKMKMMSGMSDMKPMTTPGMKDMEMGTKEMGMGMKGREMMGGKGMAGMKTPAALPAFPGTSHIYHIGSTGFFLDHPEQIKLTTEQQTALNQAKEKGMLEQSSFQGKIDGAEQEMGALTSSDKPDAAKIDGKVREIEKLRGDQRLAFIRAVGEAAKLLNDEQRQSLGTGADMTAKPDPHAGHKQP